jgi:hypothetical protein
MKNLVLKKYFSFMATYMSLATIVSLISLSIVYCLITLLDKFILILIGLICVGVITYFYSKANSIDGRINSAIASIIKAHLIGLFFFEIYSQITDPMPLLAMIAILFPVFILGFIPSCIISIIGIVLGIAIEKTIPFKAKSNKSI